MGNINSWLNINPSSGTSGETQLSLTALTNNSLSAKTATITAKNTTYNVEDTTTVTIQGFVPTLTLSSSTLRFDSTGGTATFTVYSNTAWTISFPALVHSYSTSAGTGDTEVTVVVSQNIDQVSKVDTGTVQDTYGVNQLYLTIVQESFIAELTVTPDDDITFVNTGSSTSVTIDTNTDWGIDCPSWVTPSAVSGSSGNTTVTFTAGENGPNDRSGQIVIYAGGKEVIINVYQPFYIPPYITVTPSAWTFNYTEDGKAFIVDSYPEWTAEVISSSETVFDTTDSFMEAIFEIPSGQSVYLWDNSGDTVAVYNGPIKMMGSSFTAPSSGTYKFRYEINSGGTTPRFSQTPYLKEIHISDKVGSINSSAFTGCSALSSVTIGTGLTSVGNYAFSGCSDLTSITITSTGAPTVSSTSFKGIAAGGTLVYPSGSDYSQWLSGEEGYLGYYFWNGGSPVGLENALTITYNVTATTTPTPILTNILYVKYVEDEDGNITFAENLPKASQGNWRYYPFSSTGKCRLKLYTRTDLGGGSYQGTNMDFTGIYTAFELQLNTCQGAFTVALPYNGSCTAITCYDNLYLSGNGQDGALQNVKSLSIVGRCNDIPRIYGSHFTNYFTGSTALTDVYFDSSGYTSLDSGLFSWCSSLSGVTLNGITSIGRICFKGCSGLRSLYLPTTLTELGQQVFSGCTQLTTITSLNTTAPAIYRDTFQGIPQNGYLRYPYGSDYSSWLATGDYYLGSYGWTGVEI